MKSHSRLNELLELAALNAFWQRQGLRPKGMGVNDFRWAVALRRADESKGTDWLVKLLRSDRSMPGELEMSPMARELLAELLERWRVKKSDRRITTLFSHLTKVGDRLHAMADEVQRLQFGERAPTGLFDPKLKLLQPSMSREQAINKVMEKWGAKWDINIEKFKAFLEGRIPFGHR